MADFLRRGGMRVHHEVRINGRIADVVGLNRELAAVELKLADWKTGLRQAISYQLACSHSYLCLPFERALKMTSKRHYFEKEGVGVLGCLTKTGEVRVVIRPRFSRRLLPFLTDFIMRSLSRRFPRTNRWQALHREEIRPDRSPACSGTECRGAGGIPWPERRRGNHCSNLQPGLRLSASRGL